jgi:hypothetical protein
LVVAYGRLGAAFGSHLQGSSSQKRSLKSGKGRFLGLVGFQTSSRPARSETLHEAVSKIFRTDAVKIIKRTIKPIGRHHPRSSSLPYADTGPTVSSIFRTLPGSHYLPVSSTLCHSAWISSMVSSRRRFIFNFIFGNRRSHMVPNKGSTVGGE